MQIPNLNVNSHKEINKLQNFLLSFYNIRLSNIKMGLWANDTFRANPLVRRTQRKRAPHLKQGGLSWQIKTQKEIGGQIILL